MSERHAISFTLNGAPCTLDIEARLNLADCLRDTLKLTGTHVGCEHGVCGACNVLVDGRSARACLMLAVQVDGGNVETIEGLTSRGIIADLQQEFVTRNALQCGYCTPGILATAAELLDKGCGDRDAIREALSGNFCRCTGYHAIVDAIETVAKKRAAVA